MFFLINKPLGISSFQAIANIRKRLGIKKIGHTGTLDPLATWLLLVATWWSTRLIPYVDKARKTYVFTVQLDGTSASLDLGTPVVFLDPAIVSNARPLVTLERIQTILETRFSGKISQIPPIYSALNVGGKRAYELARTGKPVEMKAREAEIFSFKVLDFSFPEVTIEMEVSAGTYIRSIAQDIGIALGLSWYVTKLHRTRIGSLGEWLANNPETLEITDNISYERIFPDFGVLEPDEETIRKIRAGLRMPNCLCLEEGKKYFVKEVGDIFSLVHAEEGVIKICANNIE